MKIKLMPGAYAPERAHSSDAGLDLKSMEDGVINPYCGETFDTGVCIAIPEGHFGKIESRSGLNINHSVVSCGGVIDSGYTGSIKVKLYNLSEQRYEIKKGDKIAQLIIQPYKWERLELVSQLEDTERGDAGFGSSGR